MPTGRSRRARRTAGAGRMPPAPRAREPAGVSTVASSARAAAASGSHLVSVQQAAVHRFGVFGHLVPGIVLQDVVARPGLVVVDHFGADLPARGPDGAGQEALLPVAGDDHAELHEAALLPPRAPGDPAGRGPDTRARAPPVRGFPDSKLASPSTSS